LSGGEAGAAVGLRFTGASLPGLIAGAEGELPSVSVELEEAAVLDERWSSAPAPELIFERPFRDGRPFLRVERDERAGYRIWALEHGMHMVSSDGTHCSSALPDAPVWRGMKLLASQTLPLLSTLRGREVLHAAGVVADGCLIGIVASSGTGKSATACNVIAQGSRFFADDVLALELVDGEVHAHPGTRLLNLHAHDMEAIPEPDRERLGEELGRSDKVHFAPDGFPTALPLRGLVFLRRTGESEETTLSPLDNPSGQLLGNAFLPYLDRGDRLARQLDVMSALARTVPLVQLEAGRNDAPAALAATVREWAGGLP
jgi:hypothetical protein